MVERDDKDRKGEAHAGEMGPPSGTEHLLLPIPVALPSSFRAPTPHIYAIPMLFLTWRGQAVTWDGQSMGVVNEQADLRG